MTTKVVKSLELIRDYLADNAVNSDVSYYKGTNPQLIKHGNVCAFLEELTSPSDELQRLSQSRPDKHSELEAYKAWKRQLPGASFGKFSRRAEDACILYSPIMAFDLDNVEGEDVLRALYFDRCEKSKYILAAWPSPSMAGLRILVLTGATQETHKAYYAEICGKLAQLLDVPLKSQLQPAEAEQQAHIDDSTSDISRLWFYHAVPADWLYFTNTVHVYVSKDNKERGAAPSAPKPQLVNPISRPSNGYKYEFSQREKVEQLISQIEGNALDITRGVQEWFKLACSLYSEFGEDGRGYFRRISQFHPDYKQSEADKTFDKAALKHDGKVTIGSFWAFCKEYGVELDYDALVAKHKAAQAAPAPKGEAETVPEEEHKAAQNETEEKAPFFKFFEVEKGHRIIIKHKQLVDLLMQLGFRRFDQDGEFFIVRIKDHVVDECSEEEVIDVFEQYIQKYDDEEIPEVTKDALLNKLYAGITSFFSPKILARLRPERPITFNEHERNCAYFYYRNGFVKVDATGVHLKPYKELKRHIWANQIIDRDFVPLPAAKYERFSFVQFVKNVANCWEKHPETGQVNPLKDANRFKAFKTLIGYLLHAYFDRDMMAVIFTDSQIAEDDESNGRSGKTLLIQSLRYIINTEPTSSTTYVEVNGKDFRPDNQFKYQNCKLDTKLVHINDARRNFNIEVLFNDITEGLQVEKKNRAPSHIRAKIAISSNKTIRVNGASAKGRIVEAELADYYNDRWRPSQEFNNEWFFSGWDKDEWGKFDAFMMDCAHTYFKHDVLRPSTINLNERKKLEETSSEFVLWMESRDALHKPFTDDGDKEQWFNKRELYEDFIGQYPEYASGRRTVTTRTFYTWLRLYCKYDDSYLPVGKDNRGGGGSAERKSDSKELIRFFRSKQEEEPPF